MGPDSERGSGLVRPLRATIEYDGTSFHGSQIQPGVRTVQGEIEKVLSKLFREPVRLHLAGRTDAGVHATAQEVAFAAPASWSPSELSRALDATLPGDIAVRRTGEASSDFHPRFDAAARRYRYVIAERSARRPFLRDRCWSPGWPLDHDALARLADLLPGARSFASFARRGRPGRSALCRVDSVAWSDRAPFLFFEIVANRFLHRMVRYLVGTSVEIAARRRPFEDFEKLLAGRAASRSVSPAPPCGLYLSGVMYHDGWNSGGGIPWIESCRPDEPS